MVFTFLGDVVEESDGDLMGDGVAEYRGAARRDLRAGRDPLLSEDAHRQVKSRLELPAADLGPAEPQEHRGARSSLPIRCVPARSPK